MNDNQTAGAMGVFPGYQLRSTARRFVHSRNGAFAPIIAFALPSILGLFGGAADYASLMHQKSQIAAIADSAALGVARDMAMARLSDAQVQSSAENYVKANANGRKLAVRARASKDQMAVDLALTGQATLPVGILKFAGLKGDLELGASSRARLGQQTKLCLLSVAEVATDRVWSGSRTVVLKEATGIHLMQDSRITANGCVLHTNVAGKDAIRIEPGARVTAELICAVGGVNNRGGTLVGQVVQDCPQIKNPMDIKQKRIGGKDCVAGSDEGTVLNSGSHTLSPGTYCGDILIGGNAKVRLNPGIYRIKGALFVRDNAELVGDRVGLYFFSAWKAGKLQGRSAYFRFLDNALIDLSAPESGEMAGMLIWENVTSAASEGRSLKDGSNYHQISSARAKRLNGTIYLPAGRLLIDAPYRIAEESDYTVLLINRLDLANGPNLVLNSNYAKSRVPVPEGLGPIGARFVRLEK